MGKAMFRNAALLALVMAVAEGAKRGTTQCGPRLSSGW